LSSPKKFPDSDPDKTVIDVPDSTRPSRVDDRARPAPESAAPRKEDERTIVLGAESDRPIPPLAEERTIFLEPPQSQPPKAARRPESETDDRTVVPGEATSEERPFELVCLSSQSRGRRFVIARGEALIGSNPSCPISIPGIEAVHAKLRLSGDQVELFNVGRVGSIVIQGGRRPGTAKLKSGDLLKIDDIVFRLTRAGEVFSTRFSDDDFAGPALARLLDPSFLNENRRFVVLGSLILVLLLLFVLWPAPGDEARVGTVAKEPAETGVQARREVETLLAAGEVLFNAGKLIAPADQPQAANAFENFNEVLSIDPGNQEALAGLRRIDDELGRQQQARKEAERQRQEVEQARLEEQRRKLDAQVGTIVAEGDRLFEQGKVTEPAGRNALVKYREALAVDSESALAKEKVQRALDWHVTRGDGFRDRDQPWHALEEYRKASRATEGRDPHVEARVRETEARLKSGMTSTSSTLVMYQDDRGQLYVLDEMEKVPARYRDRAVVVQPEVASGARTR